MSVLNPNRAFTQGILGVQVDRATAALPQTAAAAIFTISGGRVAVTSIVGEVTTVIQTQADNTKLTFDPTAAGATQDLCAVLDISADAVGTMYGITGTPATAMGDNLNFLPPSKQLAGPLVLKPGQILLDCAASNTGSVKWTLTYVPLDDGAAVAAA
jgi:hypothetical protein